MDNKQSATYLFLSLIIATLLYYIYKFLHVESRITTIIPYDKSLNWKKTPECWYDDQYHSAILADFFVMTSVNSALVGNLKYDYLHLDVIKKILMAGARYLEFTIMDSDLTEHPEPVVTNGNKEGQVHNTLNSLPFQDVCLTVKKYGFQSYLDNKGELSDNNYPLFIYLDIKTDNINTIEDIVMVIKKTWKSRLLDIKYNYKHNDLAQVPVCDLFGKIIIMSNNSLHDTPMDDLINYNKLLRIHYKEIPSYNLLKKLRDEGFKVPSSNEIIASPHGVNLQKLGLKTEDIGKYLMTSNDYLMKYCQKNLVIVYPNYEGELSMKNYDSWESLSNGCQFIGFNFQLSGKELDKYQEMFKESPFRLKDIGLREHRREVQEVKEIKDDYDSFLDTVMSRFELNYNMYGVALVPFFSDSSNLREEEYTFKLKLIKTKPYQKQFTMNPYQFKETDLFQIVRGLNGKQNTISFQSLSSPNKYLNSGGQYIQVLNNERTNLYNNEVSFYVLPDDVPSDDGRDYYKFVSYNNRKEYIRVIDGHLELDSYNGQPTFNDEVRFALMKVPIDKYFSFKDYKGRYIRIIEGGYLTSNSPAITHHSKFLMKRTDDGQYNLMAGNGKYLRFDGVSQVVAETPFDELTRQNKFQIKRIGNYYSIITYLDPKQKTFNSLANGDLQIEYDGNVIKEAESDMSGREITPPVKAPELGVSKYFYLKSSYGIKDESED